LMSATWTIQTANLFLCLMKYDYLVKSLKYTQSFLS